MPANQLMVFIEGESLAGPFALIGLVGDMTVDKINQGIAGQGPTGEEAVTQTVTVVTQTGLQGQPGPQGPAGPGGTTTREVCPDFDGLYACDAAAETWLDQSAEDFDLLAAGQRSVELLVRAKAPQGVSGTVRVRVGGTAEQPDGTLVATATVTGDGNYATYKATGSLTNPTGVQPVKLTLESGTEGQDLIVKEANVRIY